MNTIMFIIRKFQIIEFQAESIRIDTNCFCPGYPRIYLSSFGRFYGTGLSEGSRRSQTIVR